MASLNFTVLELALFSHKKQLHLRSKFYQEHLQKNKPQEMVTQYACNKPASWPFNVKPSVAKKDLLSQSLEWYMHCVVLVTFVQEQRQTHKVTLHIITSLGVVLSLSTLISKLSRAKVIGSFKLQVSLWLADLMKIS